MARLKFSTENIPVIKHVKQLAQWHASNRESKANQMKQKQLFERFNDLDPADRDREISERLMRSRVEDLGAAFDEIGLVATTGYELRELSQFPEATQGKNNLEKLIGHGFIIINDAINNTSFLGRRLENRQDRAKQEKEQSFAQVFARFLESTIVRPLIAKGEIFPGNDENNPTLITIQMNDLQLEKFIQVFPYGDIRTKAADALLDMLKKDHPPEGKRSEVLIYLYISKLKKAGKDIYQSTVAVCPASMSMGTERFSQFTLRRDLQESVIKNPNEAIALSDGIQGRTGRLVRPEKPSYLHQVAVKFA